MTYAVSQQFYFREIHRSVPAGGTVYLDDDVAQRYMQTHPGLLSPMRQTTQGAPKAVRSSESTEEAPPADAAQSGAPAEGPKRRKKSA